MTTFNITKNSKIVTFEATYVVWGLKQFSHRPEENYYEMFNTTTKEIVQWNRDSLLKALEEGKAAQA